MKVTIYMSKDKKKFSGTIDDKEFDYTVEEFVNLIGAFQKALAKVQGVELDESDIISTDTLGNK